MRFAQLPLGGPFVFTTLLVLSVCTLGFPGLSVTSLEAASRARVDSKIIERIFSRTPIRSHAPERAFLLSQLFVPD